MLGVGRIRNGVEQHLSNGADNHGPAGPRP